MVTIATLSDYDYTDANWTDGSTITESKLDTEFGAIETPLNALNTYARNLKNHWAAGTAPSGGLEDGVLWYDTTNDHFQGRMNGAWETICGLTQTQTLTNKTLSGSSITFDGTAWPSFRADRNSSNQTNITGIDQVEFNDDSTTGFDTNSDYNTTTFRFTPTVAGKYILTVSITWSALIGGDVLDLQLQKNGSILVQAFDYAYTTTSQPQSITIIDDANGSTDYYEIYAQNQTRNTSTILGAATVSYFCGSRIA